MASDDCRLEHDIRPTAHVRGATAERGSHQTTRCVVTRIEFDSWGQFAYGLLQALRLRAAVRRSPGLIESTLAIRKRSIVMVSLWESRASIAAFHTSCALHTSLANWALFRIRARVWSARFSIERTGHMSQWLSWRQDGIRSIRPS